MNTIEFNHQRGGGTAGAVGNITHERVYIKSSFIVDAFTEVLHCRGAFINEKGVVPNWPLLELDGEWKPSIKSSGWKIGTIPLVGDGLYYLKIKDYRDIFFEVAGHIVNPVANSDLSAVLERMFADQIMVQRKELASIKAARDEELHFACQEAEAQHWPALNGSDKQVAWAMTIRAKVAKRNPTTPELRTRTAAKYWIDAHK